MRPVLTAKGLIRRFGDVSAVDGVDFALNAGEAVALLGPNGAGKTSLLRILAGPDRPDSGSVSRAEEGVGWAPQNGAVYPRLTVRENLELFSALDGVANPKERTTELIGHAALEDYEHQRAQRLSTGTLQRLNLCAAICGRPVAVLLDEPTATLSPEQRNRLWEWITALRTDDDLAVLFSTQSVPEAVAVADRTVIVVDGKVAFEGTPAELARHGSGDPEAAFLHFAAVPS